MLFLLFFNSAIFITTSISVAPLPMAFKVSNTFVSVVFAPKGNPITVHIFTSDSRNRSADKLTHVGFTHTDANPYCMASWHN
ncbi:hypothetical protein Bsph_0505 [Lysinibacillus sphaericus C3-41]|uniref:Secreted protein n=1 Tax=Lysinibacillus sphaericus (strain C3-41) TaxID=444177 RepID=B1HWH4_LYSSC|nr:hypothetical protein Bsph_0505 [Lysinibacillus sphaericus C3-41]